MLEIVPEGDAVILEEHQVDDAIRCKSCDQLITRGRWRMVVREAHDHTVFNPAGIVFCVLCFEEAPGVQLMGRSSDEFTWFPGFKWRIALCSNCQAHVGWVYDGAGSPKRFYGLIKAALKDVK